MTEIFQSKFSVIPYLTFCDWKMLLDLAMVNKNAWRYSMEHYREHTEAVCDEKFPTVCQRFPSFKSDVLRYGLPDLRHALVRSNGEYWLYPVWRRVRVVKDPPQPKRGSQSSSTGRQVGRYAGRQVGRVGRWGR